MGSLNRFAPRIGLAVLSLILFLFALHFLDLLGQYRTYEYALASITTGQSAAFDDYATPQDRIIVMAKLEREETDWVKELLPDWQRAIYVVDSSADTTGEYFRTTLNKGHESLAYFTYIVDNYDSLPSTIAFLHPHQSGFLKAWHTDTPLHENVYAMQHLQLDYVQSAGYVNLRCKWNPGCKKAHRASQNVKHITQDVWQTVFANTSTPPTRLSTMRANDTVFTPPEEVGVACCAQFVVSRDQVHKRPREDYVRFRQWVIDTELDDAKSGRVMEYLWHIIFGMEAVHCPAEGDCYCRVYGLCS